MREQDEAGGEEREKHSLSKSGPPLPDEVAFVGKDVEFKGVMRYSGTVRIEGALDGEIHTDGGLLVGPEAVIKAKVSAGTVVCHGTITGDILAKKIVLCASAVVQGSLTAPVLSIDEGVVFNGTLEMKPQAKVEVLREVGPNAVNVTSRPPVQRLVA